MKFASAFSGIGTDHIAWAPLGWQCAWFAETDKFPCEVLRQRFPDVSNLGDVTKIGAEHGPVDLLVGGSPCQSFSIAGKRKGMDDPRGSLALEFLALARRLRARWFVFENVPGLLSSNGGRGFARFLRAVSEHGYGAFWRVLDAQNFGVPQRRRRVFLVGYLGDWRPAAAVLLERESLRGNSAKSEKEREEVAGTLEARAGTGGHDPGAHGTASGHLVPMKAATLTRQYAKHGGASAGKTPGVAEGHLIHTLLVSGAGMDRPSGMPAEGDMLVPFVAHTLRGEGFDASEDGTGRGTPLVSHALNARGAQGPMDGESETFIVNELKPECLPVDTATGTGQEEGGTPSERSCGVMSVRRLTPR